MPTLIRDRDAVRGATMEDLNHTYRALKGEPDFKGFTTRAAAEVQVQMAIMAAEDAVGHAGVPKGVRPKALTPAEVVSNNPYKEGTMSHKLHETISQQTPITPNVTEQEKKSSRRPKIDRVMVTGTGDSKPQAGSIRNQILQFITAAPNGMATVAELEAHFNQPVRGHLQKLIEKNHLVILEENEQ